MLTVQSVSEGKGLPLLQGQCILINWVSVETIDTPKGILVSRENKTLLYVVLIIWIFDSFGTETQFLTAKTSNSRETL